MQDWRRAAWTAFGAALMTLGGASAAAYYAARVNALVPEKRGILIPARVDFAAPFLLGCYFVTALGLFLVFWSMGKGWLPGISRSEADRAALHRLVGLAVQQSSLPRTGTPSAPALSRFPDWDSLMYEILSAALGPGEADLYRSPLGLPYQWNHPPEQDLEFRHQRLVDLLTRLPAVTVLHTDYKRWQTTLESYP